MQKRSVINLLGKKSSLVCQVFLDFFTNMTADHGRNAVLTIARGFYEKELMGNFVIKIEMGSPQQADQLFSIVSSDKFDEFHLVLILI